MKKIYIVTAIIFGTLSILIWFIFLMPVTEYSALGTIRTKDFKPASAYIQQQSGSNRGFRTSTEIPIAESYVFKIVIDGSDQPVSCSFNTVTSQNLFVGSRVHVKYTKRSFGPFWQRIYVQDVTLAEK